MIGTPNYVAPEVIIGSKHGPEVDWWAVGIIMFECLAGTPPFCSPVLVDLFSEILRGQIDWSELEEEISELGIDLMKRLLHPEPKERLGHGGANEVKAHPYFDDIDWDTLLTEKALFIPKLTDPTDTSYFGNVQVKNLSLDMTCASTTDNNSSTEDSEQESRSPDLHAGKHNLSSSTSFEAFGYVNYNALAEQDRKERREKLTEKTSSPILLLRRGGRERSMSNPEHPQMLGICLDVASDSASTSNLTQMQPATEEGFVPRSQSASDLDQQA